MGTNKKPRKAYKPKEVFNHALIGSMAVFDPIRRALKLLKEDGKLNIDEEGIALVYTLRKEPLGFGEGMLRVVDLMNVYNHRLAAKTNITAAVDDIKTFAESLISKNYDYEEEFLEKVIEQVDANMRIISKLPAKEIADIIRSVRIMNLNN